MMMKAMAFVHPNNSNKFLFKLCRDVLSILRIQIYGRVQALLHREFVFHKKKSYA